MRGFGVNLKFKTLNFLNFQANLCFGMLNFKANFMAKIVAKLNFLVFGFKNLNFLNFQANLFFGMLNFLNFKANFGLKTPNFRGF